MPGSILAYNAGFYSGIKCVKYALQYFKTLSISTCTKKKTPLDPILNTFQYTFYYCTVVHVPVELWGKAWWELTATHPEVEEPQQQQ